MKTYRAIVNFNVKNKVRRDKAVNVILCTLLVQV